MHAGESVSNCSSLKCIAAGAAGAAKSKAETRPRGRIMVEAACCVRISSVQIFHTPTSPPAAAQKSWECDHQGCRPCMTLSTRVALKLKLVSPRGHVTPALVLVVCALLNMNKQSQTRRKITGFFSVRRTQTRALQQFKVIFRLSSSAVRANESANSCVVSSESKRSRLQPSLLIGKQTQLRSHGIKRPNVYRDLELFDRPPSS